MDAGNQFSTRSVIKTAWHNVKGTKWAIWAPELIMVLIYLGIAVMFGVVGRITGFLAHGMEMSMGFITGLLIFEIVAVFLISPLAGGIQMVALKRSRGETLSASTGFQYWHKWIPLGFTVLFFVLGNLIINQIFSMLIRASATLPVVSVLLSVLLLIAALLYITFFVFNILFVADKDKGPWKALGDSAKIVAPHWFRVLLLLIYLLLIYVVIALPAVLGFLCPQTIVKILGVIVSLALLIWGVPYSYLILATTFHKLSR